ncbi:hypothetical protein FOC4_g10003733 [Fusarium odoratissimum]|uniref:Uncharacterized protein n=1 Tax=Fusarium oxysporum f. sp. cubense (strain race 4) TaxID=2502994 RepID=N1S1D7_FUSC4|nr:hypothetical protein FOC4_g10003733 [Fusarium odoratissimum]
MSVFDREEHNWHIHLNGAKEIIRRERFTDTPGSSSDFLLTWWLYHDVLAAFNYPSCRLKESPGSVSTSALYAFSGDKSLIVGSLGCSVEVLEIIDKINMMRLHSAHDFLSTSTLRSVRSIGNIKVLRDVIESIWKQQDLRSIGKAGQRVDWLQFVECDVPVPWFI